MGSKQRVQVGVLLVSLGCDTGPSADHDDGGSAGSSSAGSASSATTSPAVGCGDGVHEPGEVCYERIATDRSRVHLHAVSIVRGGAREDALVLVSQEGFTLDGIVALWQVRDGAPGAITQPLLVPNGIGLYFFDTVDLHGDGDPEIVARSLANAVATFTIFSLDGDTLVRTEPIESHPQAPYSGGPFLAGDVDRDGREEIFYYGGRLARLSEDGVEVLAEVSLGGCGTLRAGQAADFNGDGLVDFVGLGSLDAGEIDCAGTEVYDPVEHRATVVLGTTDPQAIEISHELEPQVVPIDVIAGDYDGDDIVDLAFMGPDGARIFLGLGDGSFGEGIPFEPDIGDRRVLRHAADVDGDGIDELVVAAGGDWLTSLHVIDDVLVGATSSELTSSESFVDSAVGDFNADGIVDFAVVETFERSLSFLVSNP